MPPAATYCGEKLTSDQSSHYVLKHTHLKSEKLALNNCGVSEWRRHSVRKSLESQGFLYIPLIWRTHGPHTGKQPLRNKEGLLGSRWWRMTIGWFWGNTFIPTPHRWLVFWDLLFRGLTMRSMLWEELCKVLRMCVYTWSTFTRSRSDFCNLAQSQSGKKQVSGKTIVGIDHSAMEILPSFTPSCLSKQVLGNMRCLIDQNCIFWMIYRFKTHVMKFYHRISSSISLSALGGHHTPPYTETTPSINTELSTRCTSDGVWQIFLLSSYPAETAFNTTSEFN